MRRLLDFVERVGNRLPDPASLFGLLALGVVALSALFAGHTVTHPGTGEAVSVVDLATAAGFRGMLADVVKNFAAFPPLGTVLATVIGVGIAEKSGLIPAALRGLVAVVPPWALSGTLVFAGVNASAAADSGFLVLIPAAAAVYAGVGRHPLAGLAAAFAGVSGGFSANLLLTSLDPLLSGLTESAARLVRPDAVVPATANWWFMIASTLWITLVGTVVSEKVVEPRLGPWAGERAAGAGLEAEERRGLLAATGAMAALLLLVLILARPGGVLRAEDGGLAPLWAGIVPLILLAFALPGLAFGVATGSIRSDKDAFAMASDALAQMGSYIVLAFFAGQFVAWFNASKLGLVVAVEGAEGLRALGLSGTPLVIGVVLVTAGLNLFIASASAKWAVLAPVFVPMLLLLGVEPAAAQAAYRVGDSCTNVITPLLPYMPLLVTIARRYVPEAGVGTLLAAMIPYSLAFLVAWTALLGLWLEMGWPLGPGF